MMTLITGAPGSGKTLHAIEKLIVPLLGTKVKEELEDGAVAEHERRVFTNINGCQFDHDLVIPGPVWESQGKAWGQGEGNKQGFHNWHQWAQPGSLIVPDEFQKIWPARPNGAPVPPDLQAMDTHRHMGVDFILITQAASGATWDRHISGLIGRHLHVRRIANLPFAIVYEWDHHSKSLMYSKAVSKSTWRYNKATFKLYKSARVHTKQKRKLPSLLFIVLGALALAAWKIPETYQRISGKGEEHQARMASLKPAGAASSPASVPGGRPVSWLPETPAPAAAPLFPLSAASAPASAPAAPVLAGCAVVRSVCSCFDQAGRVMRDLEPGRCESEMASIPVKLQAPVRVVSDPGEHAWPGPAQAVRDGEALRSITRHVEEPLHRPVQRLGMFYAY